MLLVKVAVVVFYLRVKNTLAYLPGPREPVKNYC